MKIWRGIVILLLFIIFIGTGLYAAGTCGCTYGDPCFGVMGNDVILGSRTPVSVNQDGIIQYVSDVTEDNITINLTVVPKNDWLNCEFTGDFKIGIIIADNVTNDYDLSHTANQRWLEAILSDVKVEYNPNDNITKVTIPDGAKIYFKAYAKDGTVFRGWITNYTKNGPVTSDNKGNLTFNPKKLIDKVKNNISNRSEGIIESSDILDLNPKGTYDYAIVTDIPIGYIDNNNLVPFNSTDIIEITTCCTNSVSVTGVELKGSFTVSQSEVIPLPNQGYTCPQCGGGEVPPTTTTTPTTEEEIQNTAEEAANAIEQGDIDTATEAIDNIGEVATQTFEEATTPDDVAQAIGTVSESIDTIVDSSLQALDTGTLEQEDLTKVVDKVEDVVKDAVSKAAESLVPKPEEVTITHAQELVKNTSQMLSSVLKAAKTAETGIGEDVITAAQSMTQKVLEGVLDDLAKQTGKEIEPVTNPEELQKTLEENPDLMDDVIDVAAVDVTSGVVVSKDEIEATLKETGIDEQTVKEVVEALPDIADPEAPILSKDGKVVKTVDVVKDSIEKAVPVPEVKAKPTDLGTVEVEVGNLKASAFVAEVKVVPPAVPEGVHYLPNGRVVSVKNGVAVVLTPAPKDPVPVISTLKKSFNDVQINKDGLIEADTGNGKLVGSFGWQIQGGAGFTANTSSAKFEVVGNNPATEDFAVKVIYPDGTSQLIAPYIAALDNFSSDMDKFFGANYLMNRDKGVLTVTVNNKTFKFKFSYYVNKIEDTDWYNKNKDSNGMAYKSGDYNGDGVMDYKVYSPEGVQIIYGIK